MISDNVDVREPVTKTPVTDISEPSVAAAIDPQMRRLKTRVGFKSCLNALLLLTSVVLSEKPV